MTTNGSPDREATPTNKTTRGKVGVQVQLASDHGAKSVSKTAVDECDVYLAGDLRQRSITDDQYRDKVQVFDFDQFSCQKKNCSLQELMEQLKPSFNVEEEEECDINDDVDFDEEDFGYDDYLSPRDIQDQLLSELHDIFLPIVSQILHQPQKYHFYLTELEPYLSHTATNDEDTIKDNSLQIKKYAKPNFRHTNEHYAKYLHNDTWIHHDTNNPEDDVNSRLSMVNIWFVFNDQPPPNTLVFLETHASCTLQSHMLHASPEQVRGKTVVHDQRMRWGSFYLFVAGQVDTCDRVLLHGAMDIVPPCDEEDGHHHQYNNFRRSVELRYTVHAPPLK